MYQCVIYIILVLYKYDGENYVRNSGNIYLNTCYSAVTGNGIDGYTAKDCIYYVIFRLTGIDSLASGTKIQKQLIVTFTDNSTCESELTEITL